MNRSESKYLSTALLMNQALIDVLSKKDYAFITIKEICQKAGVNRSTFYLHYDSINDLLVETIENLNKQFTACFSDDLKKLTKNISNSSKDDLILIRPEFLLPYLQHVKEHKAVYKVSAKQVSLMKSDEKYKFLQKNVLYPIFDKFSIDESDKKYFCAYYINGVYAIVDEWIKDGCRDEISKICELIIKCVRPFEDGDKGKISKNKD